MTASQSTPNPQPVGGNDRAAEVAHEVAEWNNNGGGAFEGWLRIYIQKVIDAGFEIVRKTDPGRPKTIGQLHAVHYRNCNCLADSAICCLPACPCKQTDSGRSQEVHDV